MLKRMYREIVDEVTDVRSIAHAQFDGRAVWQRLKPLFAEWDASRACRAPMPWNDGRLPPVCMVAASAEINHFVEMLHRIPRESDPSIRKCLQLAFNVGQLKSARSQYDTYVAMAKLDPDRIEEFLGEFTRTTLEEHLTEDHFTLLQYTLTEALFEQVYM